MNKIIGLFLVLCFSSLSSTNRIEVNKIKRLELNLKDLALIAKKQNLYKKFKVFSLLDLVKVLSLDIKTVRDSLENNNRYYVSFIKSKVKTVICKNCVKSLGFRDNSLVLFLSDGTTKKYFIKNADSTVNSKKIFVPHYSQNLVRVYNILTNKIEDIIKHNCCVALLAVSNNGRYVASYSYDGTIKIAGDISGLSDKEFFSLVEDIENSLC